MKLIGSWIPARVNLAILCATGVMELYMSRVNLSIAIMSMVQTVNMGDTEGNVAKEPYCVRDEVELRVTSPLEEKMKTVYETIVNNSTAASDIMGSGSSSRILMTSTERGNVLSAFFYSYFLSAILGGRLAEIFGTKIVFTLSGLVDGLGNFLIPVAAKSGYLYLFFIRFAMGFFQGGCYPSLHALQAKWIPPDEVSRFVGFVFMSNSIGTILTLSVGGIIISALGWEALFYTCGSVSFLWTTVWLVFMYDSPEKHPRISSKEKNYILECLESQRGAAKAKPKKAPWTKMLTSLPLWAIFIAHAGNMFGINFYITQLPLYMSSIIGINIRNNGFISSLPFLARFCGSNTFSWLSNYLMKIFPLTSKKWMIILTIIGFSGPGICLVLVGYSGCSATMAMVFFTIGFGLNGATSSGYMSNFIALAPNFAGTALGMSNSVAFLYAMIAPVLIGALTPEETLNEWIIVYWISFINFAASGLFYCIFLSTELQPWNNVSEKEVESPRTEQETEKGLTHEDPSKNEL